MFEAGLVAKFGELLDQSGMPLPDGTYSLVEELREIDSYGTAAWLWEARSLLALAQHHGMPTRRIRTAC